MSPGFLEIVVITVYFILIYCYRLTSESENSIYIAIIMEYLSAVQRTTQTLLMLQIITIKANWLSSAYQSR